MRTEIDLRQLAKDFERHEGRKYQMYLVNGLAHIGVCRLIDGSLGGAVSDEEIDLMLANDIDRHIGDLDKVLPWWRELHPEPRQRALALMALQLGVPRLREFTKMLAALQKQNWHVASLEARASRWATQTPERAKEVAQMLRDG